MTELETLRAERETLETMANEFDAKAALTLNRINEKIAALEAAPKPWPQVGDEYWCLDWGGKLAHDDWAETKGERGALSIGNVFRTEQEAIDERDRRKVAAIMREMADGGFFVIRPYAETIVVQQFKVLGFCEQTFSTPELADACISRIVTELSEGGTRDGMARLLELWVVK